MRKGFLEMAVLMLFLLIVICAGCQGRDGADGRDGSVYIAYSWLYGSLTYLTDDPGIGSVIGNGKYYKTRAGTWNYWYKAWDNTEWAGTYRLYVNRGERGEEGGWFWQSGRDGRDGADICFELQCFSVGPSLFVGGCAGKTTSNREARIQSETLRAVKAGIRSAPMLDARVLSRQFGGQSLVDIQDPGVRIEADSTATYSYLHYFKRLK